MGFAQYRVMGRIWRAVLLWLAAATICAAQRYPFLLVPDSPHGIFTLMQDRESRIWLGTIDNVYSFDGERFYSLRDAGYPHEIANSYAEDPGGDIWIGTQGADALGGKGAGGLYRYHGGHIEKLLAGDILSVVAAGSDAMLASVATESPAGPAHGDLYLFRMRAGTWAAEKVLTGIAGHMSVDHQGNILFTCPGGWCEIAQSGIGQWLQHRQPLTPVHHAGSSMVERVLRDRYGCVWWRGEVFAGYQCPADPAPVQLTDDTTLKDPSQHLEETSDGSIFMLVRMTLGRPGHFHVANIENGVPDGMGTAMVARDGTIWIGTSAGLYRFMYPFQLQLWNKSIGVGTATSLIRFDGRVYAADHGLAWLDDNRMLWNRLPSVEGLSDVAAASPVSGLSVLGASGLIRLGAGNAVKSVTKVPLGKHASAMAATPDGTLWLGADGIYKIEERSGRPVIEPQSLPGPPVEQDDPQSQVNVLEYDASRQVLWACYGKRILYNREGVWRQITQRDGLQDEMCRSLAPLPDGNLWVSYAPANYSYIQNPLQDHPVIHNFPTINASLVENAGVLLLGADPRGRMWMEDGEALRAAGQKMPEMARPENWLRLDKNDGVNMQDVDFGHAFLTDPDGSVWFSISDGVAHFSPPDDFASSFPAPPVFVAGFSVGNGAPVLAEAQHGIPRTESIDAYIGCLQFNRRNALQIRYRLLPEQSSWTTSNNLRIALGKPGWGRHTLEVQARLSTGPWSGTVAQSISIAPPPWFTWQALAGFSIAGFAFFAGGVRWRRGMKERRAKLSIELPDLAGLRLSSLFPELGQLDSMLLDNRFEAGRVLARGGFAIVAEGCDQAHEGRRCAIKIFRQELGDSEWTSRRFQQEVLALELIHHPNVVQIYGSGILPSGTMYLAMEFIEGVTLREQMETGRLPFSRTAAYLRQIGSALDAIHAHGIYHRDVKPENLMIRAAAPPREELVLIDFSIAIVKDPDKTVHGLSRAAGSIRYMAPEQAIGYAVPATDIYSLAKVLIEMITGTRLADLLPDASMDLPLRVRELVAALPIPFSDASIALLSAALEFDPARRPKRAGEFADQIAADLERAEKV